MRRGPSKVLEWAGQNISTTVAPTSGGGVELRPNNQAPNQYLINMAEGGRPLGWLMPDFPNATGRLVHLTKAGRGLGTLSRQPAAPFPKDQPSWLFNKLRIEGPQPVRKKAFAAPLPRPPAPTVTVMPSTNRGLLGGTYPYAQAFRDKHRNRTTATGSTSVTVLNGQGIRLPAPTNIPENAAYVEHLLGEPNKGDDTLRVIRSLPIPGKGLEEVIVNTYRARERAAARNNTKVGKPARPIVGEHVREEEAAFDLQEGVYRIGIVLEDPKGGRSLFSPWSDEIRVEGEIEPYLRELQDGENPAAGETLVTRDGKRYARGTASIGFKRGRAIRVRPVHLPRDYRFWVYVMITPLNSGTESIYHAYEKSSSTTTDSFGRVRIEGYPRRGVPIYGYAGRETAEEGGEPSGLRHGLKQSDHPQEDTTGIETPDPNVAPDAPVAIGAADIPAAGTYSAAVSDVIEAPFAMYESLHSPATSFTLDGTQMAQIKPSHPISLVPNAEQQEKDKNGDPIGWIKSGVAGGITFPELGVIKVDTLGIARTGTAIPTTYHLPLVSVNASESYMAVADVEVESLVEGSGGVQLDQFDVNGNFLSTIPITTVSGVGTVEGEKAFGANGTAFSADTAQVRLVVKPQGASVNMVYYVRNLALHPFQARLRKYDLPDASSTIAAEPNPPPSASHATDSFSAVGPAPSVPGPLAPPEPPLDDIDFKNGMPAGWTTVATGGTQVTTDTTHDYPLRFLNQTSTTGASGYIYKDYPVDTKLAMRFVGWVETDPTRGRVHGFMIRSDTGQVMAGIRHHDDGHMYLRTVASGGVPQEMWIGHIGYGRVDIEIVVSNGASKNGTVVVYYGEHNNPRTYVGTISNINWTGTRPVRVVDGITAETDPAAHWDYRARSLTVTRNGSPISGSGGQPPAGHTPPEPDAPKLSAAVAASLTVGSGASGVTYTAQSTGDEGNAIRVAHVNPGVSAVLAVSVSGNDITVNLATDAAGAVTSTATQVRDAVNANAGASALVAATLPGGGTGIAIAQALTNLSGGADAVYRLYDPDGEQINQFYTFIASGAQEQDHPLLGYNSEISPPIAVVPGEHRTVAVQGREHVFPGNSYEPTHPICVELRGKGVEPFIAARLYGDAGIDSTSDQTNWTGVDRWDEYDVPAGYTEARYIWLRSRPGIYVNQEVLDTVGSHTTQAARDARRGYGRATSGTVAVTLDTKSPHTEFTPQYGNRWAKIQAKQSIPELPTGNSFQNITYRSSDTEAGLGSATSYSDWLLVPERRFVRISGTLTGDGRNGPQIGPFGISLNLRPNMGVLLRDDGTSLDGEALVGHLPGYYERPDYNLRYPGGRTLPVAITDSIRKLPGFTVHVSTETAWRELLENCLEEEWLLDLPMTDGIGKQLRIRPTDIIEPSEENMLVRVVNGVRRNVAKLEVEGAEVLEVGPMPKARP